jgi:hypothetical protein
MRTALALSLIVVSTAGCPRVARVQVLHAAQVDVPRDIRTVGVIDRSGARNTGQAIIGSLEGLVTGEGIYADRDGRDAAIDAVATTLADSPRFEVVLLNESKKSRKTSLWDAPLTRSDVRKLCGRRCDGIVSLEAFDSDSNTLQVAEKVVEGKVVEATVSREVDVLTSWRFYSARTGDVIDAQREARLGRAWDATGTSYDDALAGLADGRGIVTALGAQAGADYAARVAPTWRWEGRKLLGGSPGLRSGARAAKAGDWAGAERTWRGVVKSSAKPKIRGKAHFNLAVAAEARGDLDTALEHAREAMALLGDGRTGRQVASIVRRERDQARALAQLE